VLYVASSAHFLEVCLFLFHYQSIGCEGESWKAKEPTENKHYIFRGEQNMDHLLSVSELADWLGLSKAAIYKRTCARTIPFIRIGNRPRFKEADIEQWLNDQSVKPVSSRNAKP